MTPLEIIMDNKTEYNGMAYIGCINPNGICYTIRRCPMGQLDKVVGGLEIHDDYNYYVTANTVKIGATRQSDKLFSLNNIVVDIDNHDAPSQEARRQAELFVALWQRDLPDMPAPNIAHYTGRGLQLWWHINSAAARLQWLYDDARDKLIIAAKWLLSEYPSDFLGMDIDYAASQKNAGYFRLFNTYNPKAGYKTDAVVLHENFYDLNTLCRQLDAAVPSLDYAPTNVPKKATYRPRLQVLDGNYTALHYKRMTIITQMAANGAGDHKNKRNLMLFLYYNAAKQIFNNSYAAQMTRQLNDSFGAPLAAAEVDKIIDGLTIRGYYAYGKIKWYAALGIDDIPPSKSNATRDAERAARKIEKDETKAEALRLLAAGKTQREVVAATGLSRSTIARLIRKP